MVEIADFVPRAPVPAEVVEAYRDRVPDDLVQVWERYGYGTFGHGFLRVVDPELHERELGACLGKTQGDGIAIPIMTTGLGDLITWEPGIGVVGILFREGRTVGLSTTLEDFLFIVELDGPDELSASLHWDLSPEAVAAHGALPHDQSFVFVPLLSMGGTATVENLQKRDTVAAIQVAVDLQGVIGH